MTTQTRAIETVIEKGDRLEIFTPDYHGWGWAAGRPVLNAFDEYFVSVFDGQFYIPVQCRSMCAVWRDDELIWGAPVRFEQLPLFAEEQLHD